MFNHLRCSHLDRSKITTFAALKHRIAPFLKLINELIKLSLPHFGCLSVAHTKERAMEVKRTARSAVCATAVRNRILIAIIADF